MSHHFKAPALIDPRLRRNERQVTQMARMIENQEQLDALLAGAGVDLRAAMLERLLPHLRFVPAADPIADCPHCGMRRGSVIPHACQVAQ